MTRFRAILLSAFLVIGFFSPLAASAQTQQPVVTAVLFYSPSCPHCLDVINEVLPPLVNQYGSQLQIYGVDTSQEGSAELYHAAMDVFDIPENNRGVPTLVVGDQILIGSGQIPNEFPGIIEQGLQEGGIPWPEIPGLQDHRAETNSGNPEDPGSGEDPGQNITDADHSLTLAEKFRSDPAGNTLAVVVLFAMIGALIYTATSWNDPLSNGEGGDTAWVVPVLLLIGLGVSLYLAYVEVTQSEAVCGPVGNCNTVQQSPYASLFGLIPIGLLGVGGYLGMIAAWAGKRFGPRSWKPYLAVFLWGMALFGTLFSIYLTFLEPFVIGASCMWCLTSAAVMTLLLLSTTEDARAVLRGHRGKEESLAPDA